MDYIQIQDRPLEFPANSANGDSVCTNIQIVNDDVLESVESFFATISSSAADIEQNRDETTINIIESNDESKYIILYICIAAAQMNNSDTSVIYCTCSFIQI